MPKRLKIIFFSEEEKGSILALLVEGYSERRVASILKISKTAVHKNKVKQQTLRTTKLQTGRGRNDSPLPGMTANSFECHSKPVG